MNTQEIGANRKGWAVIYLTFLLVVLVPSVRAADEYNTGRIVQHVQKAEMFELGDVPKHTMGVRISSGLIFYTSEIATTRSVLYFDLVDGKGTLIGKREITYQDGSFMFLTFSGTSVSAEGGKSSVLEGTYECQGGRGRFDGWKGTGTYKGVRIGTGGDSYVDITDNCKKP